MTVFQLRLQEFDIDVDALFEHLFSSDSDIMKRIHETRKMLGEYKHINIELMRRGYTIQ